MENTRQITALNNALRSNPCFREITGVRSIKTDSGYDIIEIIQHLLERVDELEKKLQTVDELELKVNELTLDDLRDVNLEGVGDNAQLGYDSETTQWVPFNVPSEDVDETQHSTEDKIEETIIKIAEE
jgi:hypothetical protein